MEIGTLKKKNGALKVQCHDTQGPHDKSHKRPVQKHLQRDFDDGGLILRHDFDVDNLIILAPKSSPVSMSPSGMGPSGRKLPRLASR